MPWINDFKYKDQGHFTRHAKDHKRNAYAEADLQCSNAIQSMEKSLKAACDASGANMDGIVKVLDTLLFEYEASSHGPGKWQKVALFLQQSFKGPVLDFTKKLIEQARSENRSLEGLVELLTKQMKDREKRHDESLTRLQAAFNRKKQDNEHLLGRVSLLDEECRRLSQTLNSTEKASLDWKSKYEKAQSAQKEAEEWQVKYNNTVRDAKYNQENAAAVQEGISREAQMREIDLREEFSFHLAVKENELKNKTEILECTKLCLRDTTSELEVARSKVESSNAQLSSKRLEIIELNKKLNDVNDKANSFERETRILKKEKIRLEQKWAEFKWFKEIQERCKMAEREAKGVAEVADKAWAEACIARRLEMERSVQVKEIERQIKDLDRQKNDLADKGERLRILEANDLWKVEVSEAKVEERKGKTELLLASNNEQATSGVQALCRLPDSERAARTEAKNWTEALTLELETAQVQIDNLQQEWTKGRRNETAWDSELKNASHWKRPRVDDFKVQPTM